MKTILFSLLMLGVSTIAYAQTVKAEFNKGDTTVYQTVAKGTMDMPMGAGREQLATTVETRYVVLDKSKNGYRLESTITSLKYDGKEEVVSQMVSPEEKYLEGVKVVFLTDANGKITKIENYEDVVAKASENALAEIEKLYKENPAVEQYMPKGNVIMAISKQLEEPNIIDFIEYSSFMGLYGKKLSNGFKENLKVVQDVKTSATYEVSESQGALNVKRTQKSNMTDEDVKAMMISNMKKMGLGEEVTSQIENNWGQMKAMGMTNLTYNSTETFNFSPKGWITTATLNREVGVMGMNMKLDQNTSIAKKNW